MFILAAQRKKMSSECPDVDIKCMRMENSREKSSASKKEKSTDIKSAEKDLKIFILIWQKLH
jgi:hypothetical protein